MYQWYLSVVAVNLYQTNNCNSRTSSNHKHFSLNTPTNQLPSICSKPHHMTMHTYLVDLNMKLAAIYYKVENPICSRSVFIDVTLSGFTDQPDEMNNFLNHKNTRRLDNVEHRLPSTDLIGSVHFTQMKLMNDNNVKTMF